MLLFGIAALIGLLIYLLLQNKSKQLKRVLNVHTGKQIPTKSFLVSFYSLIQRRNLGFEQAFKKAREEYGTEYGSIFFYPAVTFTKPEDVKQVLKNIDQIVKSPPPKPIMHLTEKVMGSHSILSMNPPHWNDHRSIMNKSFSNNRPFFKPIESKIVQCLDLWLLKKKDVSTVFVGPDVKKMTLDVLGACVFGKDFDTLHGHTAGPLNTCTFLSTRLLCLKYILFPFLLNLPLSESKMAQKVLKEFDDYCWQIIKESKHQPEGTHLVSLLLSNNLPDQVVRDNIGVFFLAGHETTANALTWGLGLFATHKDAQAKMKNEVATITNNFTRKLQYDDMKDLIYIDCFIKETLRLYPAAASLTGRRTATDVTIGDWFIPANTELQLDLISMLYDPTIWSDPYLFDPERFLSDRITKEQRSAWLAFSCGPRVCIGMSFSMLEQKLFWVHLVTVFSEVSMAEGCALEPIRSAFLFAPNYEKLGLLFKERRVSE